MNRYLPYALVIMAVVFSVIGMVDQGLHPGRIVALALLHLIFVKLLSGTLETVFSEWDGNLAKALVTLVLGSSFLAFDIWLVHYGFEWVFQEWNTVAIFAGSIAFAMINVFAHWAYTPTPDVDNTKADDANGVVVNINRHLA